MADEENPAASNVKPFKLMAAPEPSVAESNIPQALRNLADDIEKGHDDFRGKVAQVVWITYTEDRNMSVGVLGKAQHLTAETSLLLQRANLIVVEGADGDYDDDE